VEKATEDRVLEDIAKKDVRDEKYGHGHCREDHSHRSRRGPS
jgi:hypothetical protein